MSKGPECPLVFLYPCFALLRQDFKDVMQPQKLHASTEAPLKTVLHISLEVPVKKNVSIDKNPGFHLALLYACFTLLRQDFKEIY